MSFRASPFLGDSAGPFEGPDEFLDVRTVEFGFRDPPGSEVGDLLLREGDDADELEAVASTGRVEEKLRPA